MLAACLVLASCASRTRFPDAPPVEELPLVHEASFGRVWATEPVPCRDRGHRIAWIVIHGRDERLAEVALDSVGGSWERHTLLRVQPRLPGEFEIANLRLADGAEARLEIVLTSTSGETSRCVLRPPG